MQQIINSSEPSIGLVIGTFAAVPYIHLQLESRKRNYPNLPVLVHDDGSHLQKELRELCAQYNADFTSLEQRSTHFIGDMVAFVAGLDWAKEKKLDLLVKFSRRFIPLFNWLPEIQELAFMTQYATYSSRCVNHGFGFRTECVAMHVQSWFDTGAVERIREQIQINQGCFVEKFIHDLAREVHQLNCEQNREYEKFGGKPEPVAAYGDWLLSGIGRYVPRPRVLWHNYTSPSDYAQRAQNYDLKLTEVDFADPNQGQGEGEVSRTER
jgi:hypothetical protein